MTEERPDNDNLLQRRIRSIKFLVMRARRINAHSLGKVERLGALRKGSMTLSVRDPEKSVAFDLPPEEQMESLAGRAHPTTLQDGDTYWSRAPEAIDYRAHDTEASTDVVVTTTRHQRRAVAHTAPVGTPVPEVVDASCGPNRTAFSNDDVTDAHQQS